MLGTCLWFGIGHGLRPLHQIAADLSRRDATGWRPIEPIPLHTEVKPLVDALNAMLLRLKHAFRAQGEFLTDAAHELRTPIMALAIYAELANQAGNAAESDAALAQMRRGVERLGHLSRQLLSLARVTPGAEMPVCGVVDLHLLCRTVLVAQLPQADLKSQELSLETTGGCSTLGDADKIELLVSNLIDNAIRYSPQGGRIQVTVRREASGVAIVVRDDGPGVPIDDRRRVFDRFYRGADKSQEGSGLGLAIVKRVADEHAAVVTLDEALAGAGLRVTVWFPNRP